MSATDELDLMLQHRDFPKLVGLAHQIGEMQCKLRKQTGAYHQSQQRLPNNSLSVEETLQATLCLQQKHLSSASKNPASRRVIERGEYPMTDTMMTDALRLLGQELKDIHRVAGKGDKIANKGTRGKSSNQSKKEAIAIKYSKWQTDVLMKWMIDHKDEPFPDQEAVTQLMQQTNLSHSQVVNWTTNVRKRNKKATCVGRKKPHHFIDFLFLVQDREAQEQNKKNETTSRMTPTTMQHRQTPMPQTVQPKALPAVVSPLRTNMPVLYNTATNNGNLQDEEVSLLEEFASTWLRDHPDPLEPLGDAIDDFLAEHRTESSPALVHDSQFWSRKRARSCELVDDHDDDLDEWMSGFGMTPTEYLA